jgi:hypothetical protein
MSSSGGTARPKSGAPITEAQVDQLEKLIGQLGSIHEEIGALSKKSPNDAVNKFKLTFVNATIAQCNGLLGVNYRPIGDFKEFNLDDVPSNSDVTLIAALYLEALEKFRSDHIGQEFLQWYYNLPGDAKVRIVQRAMSLKSGFDSNTG